MADKKGIEKLDAKLLSSKIVSKQYKADLPLVHRKMNSIIKKTGKVLSDTVFETGNVALRKWLSLLAKQGASQAKLTAYLRCGLAHLTYDYVESQYKKIGAEDLIARTLVSMKNRKLHNCFFKPQVEPASPAKKAAKPKKKIEPVLKTLAYKKGGAKKKPPKKPAAKKAAAKKTAPKKKAAPKKAAAKKSAKKPAAKKAKAKKPSAKKSVAKKKAVLKTLAYRKSPAKKASPKKGPAKAAPKKPASRKKNIVKAISRKAEALRSRVKKAVKGRKTASKKSASGKKPAKVKSYSYNDRLTYLVR